MNIHGRRDTGGGVGFTKTYCRMRFYHDYYGENLFPAAIAGIERTTLGSSPTIPARVWRKRGKRRPRVFGADRSGSWLSGPPVLTVLLCGLCGG